MAYAPIEQLCSFCDDCGDELPLLWFGSHQCLESPSESGEIATNGNTEDTHNATVNFVINPNGDGKSSDEARNVEDSSVTLTGRSPSGNSFDVTTKKKPKKSRKTKTRMSLKKRKSKKRQRNDDDHLLVQCSKANNCDNPVLGGTKNTKEKDHSPNEHNIECDQIKNVTETKESSEEQINPTDSKLTNTNQNEDGDGAENILDGAFSSNDSTVDLTEHRDEAHFSADSDDDNTPKSIKSAFCEICGLKISSDEAFNEHMKQIHSGFSFKCFVCGSSYINLDSLVVHLAKYSSSVFCGAESRFLKQRKSGPNQEFPYYCNLCGCGFTLIKLLIFHKKEGHKPHVEKAKDVEEEKKKGEDRVHKTASESITNKATADDSSRRFCELCGAAFLTLEEKQKHFHLDDFLCFICRRTFDNLDQLANHYDLSHAKHEVTNQEKVQISLSNKPKYYCLFCGRGFHFINELLSHKEVEHFGLSADATEKPNITDFERIFEKPSVIPGLNLSEVQDSQNSSSEMNEERLNQSSEFMNASIESSKAFDSYSYSSEENSMDVIDEAAQELVHLLTEEAILEEAQVYCEACGLCFDSADSLDGHFVNNHNQSHFQCSVCGGDFKNISSLMKHQKNYSEGTLVKHEECSFLLLCSKDVPAHFRYYCNSCGKGFNYITEMKQHISKMCPRGSDGNDISASEVSESEHHESLAESESDYDDGFVVEPNKTQSSQTALINSDSCISCGEDLTYSSKLNNYKEKLCKKCKMAAALEMPLINCSVCNKTFTSKRALKEHEEDSYKHQQRLASLTKVESHSQSVEVEVSKRKRRHSIEFLESSIEKERTKRKRERKSRKKKQKKDRRKIDADDFHGIFSVEESKKICHN